MRIAPPAVLVTLPLSHFCEKARWGLDRAGHSYQEQPHAPLLHRLATRGRDGGTVPLLIDGAHRFTDSTSILVHADAMAGRGTLYPREAALRSAVDALEETFDTLLGPHTRRWAYYHLLPRARLTRRLWSAEVPRREALLVPLFAPVGRRLVRVAYRITPESAQRSLGRVREVFHQVDQSLGDGRRFLVGDRFTAADLTFAALAGPALLPEGCRAVQPGLDQVPEDMRAEVLALRATAAGRFALRLFRDERASRARPAR